MPELSAEDLSYYKEVGTSVCPKCGSGYLAVELGGDAHECAPLPTNIS